MATPTQAQMQTLPTDPPGGIALRPKVTVLKDRLKVTSLKAQCGSKIKCNYMVMAKKPMEISEASELLSSS